MTDHDRGAYTPQTDAPLAFDARQPRGGGGGGGGGASTTLIISGVVLIALIIGVVMFYRGGVRAPNEAPQPVGEPIPAMKSAPPADSQPPAGEPPLAVYESGEGTAAAPAFAPAPEQPLPRPAPRPTVGVQSNALEPVGPPPIRPAVPAVQTPPPGPVAAQPKTAPAVTPAPAPAATGGALVQIGAFSSEALAAKGWGDVAMDYPADMAGKGRKVEAVQANGATLYRGQITGFASREAAAAFCSKLKASGKSCIVK